MATLRNRSGLVAVTAATLCVSLTACGDEAPARGGPLPGDELARVASDQATSILNAGVMTEHGPAGDDGLKFLFDPLYDDHFGSLEQLTPELIEAIVSGAPPYDGVDAVFVSHAHGDHFSESQLTQMMQAQDGLILVMPEQAIDSLRKYSDWDASFEDRVRTVSLANGEASEAFEIEGAMVEAFRSPHSGWPDRHSEVHNITFRVSAPSATGQVSRVMHVGDADPAPEHFLALQEFLEAKRTGLTMVPFWFYRRDDVASIIDQTLNAQAVVAVHVPVDPPAYLEEGTLPYFSGVGEVLEIPATE